MSSNELPDLNLLYRLTLKEIQNNDIQHLNPDFYKTLSHFLGKLKTEEYDGLEAKAKTKLVNLTSSLTSLLLNIRLENVIIYVENPATNILSEALGCLLDNNLIELIIIKMKSITMNNFNK